jgi:hypothetical protein
MEPFKILSELMEPFSEKCILMRKIAIVRFIKFKNIIGVSRPYITVLSAIIIEITKFHFRLAKITV